MRTITLTDAQLSAIECRDVSDFPGTVRGRTLRFKDAAAMAEWMNEASNGEDAHAEMFGCKYARRAAVSLAFLYGKVLRMEDEA